MINIHIKDQEDRILHAVTDEFVSIDITLTEVQVTTRNADGRTFKSSTTLVFPRKNVGKVSAIIRETQE